MQHNLNLFETLLPPELKVDIFNRLPVKAKGALTLSASSHHVLFQPQIDEEHFFHLVKEASYPVVATLARANPSLIFKPLGDELISPLAYAFKVYDTYMWQLFETIIKEECPLAMPTFDAILLAQNEFIDLNAAIMAYQNFHAATLLFGNSSQVPMPPHLLACFKTFIQQQKQLIPAHMLYEFCRNEFGCEDDAPFDKLEPSEDCNPWNRDIPPDITGKVYDRIPLLPSSKTGLGSQFGVTFGVLRQPHSGCAWVSKNPFEFFLAVSTDIVILNRLFHIRKQQLELRRSPLIQPAPQPS